MCCSLFVEVAIELSVQTLAFRNVLRRKDSRQSREKEILFAYSIAWRTTKETKLACLLLRVVERWDDGCQEVNFEAGRYTLNELDTAGSVKCKAVERLRNVQQQRGEER